VETPVQATFEGTAECKAIGDGSGSFCKFDVVAKTPSMIPGTTILPPLPDSMDSAIVPLVILYGLDPEKPGVRFTWVGGRSAWEASGSLASETVTPACVSRSCSGMASMRISGRGKRIESTFVFNPGQRLPPILSLLEMKRLQEEAAEASAAELDQEN
jgi:hypothetical protein